MEPVPAYIALYLLKIRRHSNEPGYLAKRLSGKGVEKAVYERSMLYEARDLHLIGFSDDDLETLAFPGWKNRPEDRVKQEVKIPRVFITLARGHWLWLEVAASCGKWVACSLLGALIALAVSGLEL